MTKTFNHKKIRASSVFRSLDADMNLVIYLLGDIKSDLNIDLDTQILAGLENQDTVCEEFLMSFHQNQPIIWVLKHFYAFGMRPVHRGCKDPGKYLGGRRWKVQNIGHGMDKSYPTGGKTEP